ncbi:MAG: MMPL family transporter [Pseudonocardiaceae bacterium]
MFTVLTRLIARPRLVLASTLLAVVVLVVLGGGVAERLLNGGTEDPASESARAAAVLNQEFPASRPNLVLVVTPASSEVGIDDAAVTAAGQQLAERLAAEQGIVGVRSYWADGEATLASDDKSSALIMARIPGEDTAADQVFRRVAPEVSGEQGAVSIQLGGPIAVRNQMQTMIGEDIASAELVVLPLILLILVLAFGSVIAALLPLGVGLIAIVGGTAVLSVVSRFTDVSIFSMNLTTALGMGLAIDYAMIVVWRFREEQRNGLTPREAATRTLGTAGRTVLFSAITVAVALSVMLLFPLYFLQSFAYAGIAVVFFAALAVLIVVPAALVLLGPWVDALDLRRFLVRWWPSQPTRARPARPRSESGWYRWATWVIGRPRIITALSVTTLLALAVPFLGVQFGAPDERQLPPGAESRVATEALAGNFGDLPDWVVDVVAEGYRHDPVAAEQAGGTNVISEAVGDAAQSPNREVAALAGYARQLSLIDGVSGVLTPVGPFQYGWQVAGPIPDDDERVAGAYTYLQVVPESDIDQASVQAQQLVQAVRAVQAPFDVQVGGAAAALVDSQAAISDRLWLALGIIMVATLLLIFLCTGSVLIPVQTVVLNALSLTVMFGAAVWVFQEGHLSGLLGFTPLGFIELSLPVLMFCLTFGLSMDYGVFVLSRMKEEYDRGRDHRSAIAFGLQRTGGLVTAAALILAIVMFAMGSSDITNIKMFGLGVGLAVLVDATVVRCLLVPAVMAITGPATWWTPPGLRRFQQRFGLSDTAPAAALPPRESVGVGS